jgi:hypothetical protein
MLEFHSTLNVITVEVRFLSTVRVPLQKDYRIPKTNSSPPAPPQHPIFVSLHRAETVHGSRQDVCMTKLLVNDYYSNQ